MYVWYLTEKYHLVLAVLLPSNAYRYIHTYIFIYINICVDKGRICWKRRRQEIEANECAPAQGKLRNRTCTPLKRKCKHGKSQWLLWHDDLPSWRHSLLQHGRFREYQHRGEICHQLKRSVQAESHIKETLYQDLSGVESCIVWGLEKRRNAVGRGSSRKFVQLPDRAGKYGNGYRTWSNRWLFCSAAHRKSEKACFDEKYKENVNQKGNGLRGKEKLVWCREYKVSASHKNVRQ